MFSMSGADALIRKDRPDREHLSGTGLYRILSHFIIGYFVPAEVFQMNGKSQQPDERESQQAVPAKRAYSANSAVNFVRRSCLVCHSFWERST